MLQTPIIIALFQVYTSNLQGVQQCCTRQNYQHIIAQSSTEAEFIAAAKAGQYILHLQTILAEIGLSQHHVTILYKDN